MDAGWGGGKRTVSTIFQKKYPPVQIYGAQTVPTFFTTFCGIELLKAKEKLRKLRIYLGKKNCEQITERTNTIERKLHAATIRPQYKIHQNYVYC